MPASGLPQFVFVFFFGSKNQEDAHGVQGDTFVSRWYANTPKKFGGNPEAAMQYSSLPGVPLAEIHHFSRQLLFPKCSAAGLRVRTANLSRWPKKVTNKIRGVEHWRRAGQTKNRKWNAYFPVSIILFPVQKLSVLKHMGFLIRRHCGTQNGAYNLPTNLFCIPRVYNETRQICYAQSIQKGSMT